MMSHGEMYLLWKFQLFSIIDYEDIKIYIFKVTAVNSQ